MYQTKDLEQYKESLDASRELVKHLRAQVEALEEAINRLGHNMTAYFAEDKRKTCH